MAWFGLSPRTADDCHEMVGSVRPCVFLDRDGVLNRSAVRDGKPYAPRTLSEFRLLPGAAASVERLHRAGFFVAVITNQPDIGNALVQAAVVDEMNQRLVKKTGVDAVRVCPHSQAAGCACRKPSPGMVLDLAQKFGLDITRSFMVGDRSTDVACGQAVGCRTIFIERGYSEPLTAEPDAIVANLPRAVDHILNAMT